MPSLGLGSSGAAVHWLLPMGAPAPGHPLLPAPRPTETEMKTDSGGCPVSRALETCTPAVLPVPTRPGIPLTVLAGGPTQIFITFLTGIKCLAESQRCCAVRGCCGSGGGALLEPRAVRGGPAARLPPPPSPPRGGFSSHRLPSLSEGAGCGGCGVAPYRAARRIWALLTR